MPKGSNIWRFAGATVLLFALVLIRLFEKRLFYDPFIDFFHDEYQGKALPAYDGVRLGFGIAFRYALNTVVSLGLLYVLFRSVSKVRFAAVLYGMLFALLALSFWIVLSYFEDSLLAIFYIRRFLIQPLFVILFIPAFYFQDRQSSVGK